MRLGAEVALWIAFGAALCAAGVLGKGDIGFELDQARQREARAHASAVPNKTCPDQFIAYQDAGELWVTHCVKAAQR